MPTLYSNITKLYVIKDVILETRSQFHEAF